MRVSVPFDAITLTHLECILQREFIDGARELHSYEALLDLMEIIKGETRIGPSLCFGNRGGPV